MIQYYCTEICAIKATDKNCKRRTKVFKFLKKDKEKKKTEATKEKAVAEEKAEKVEEEEKTEIVVEGEESVESSNAEKRAIKAVYRVIYDSENREWMVKKDGAQRVIRRVRTKAEALELANQFATRQDLSISVQKKDGKFQKKSSYKTMMSSDKADK